MKGHPFRASILKANILEYNKFPSMVALLHKSAVNYLHQQNIVPLFVQQ